MKKRILILLLAFTVTFFVACNTENTNKPSDDDSTFVEYGVAGIIKAIETLENQEGIKIHVLGDENNGATYDNAWVTVNEDTIVYLNEKESYNFLEVGQYVHVFFEGPVAESYPVQALAKQINVIPEDSTETPDNESTFVEYGVAGLIEEVEFLDNEPGVRIHVVGDENNGATYDNAWVTVNEDTIVYLNEKESYNFLEVGQYVHVFFEGPAAESDPVQALAKQINVIPEDDTSLPDNDSSFVEYGVAGLIEAVEILDNESGVRIHVMGDENNGAIYDNAWVIVNQETIIYLYEEENYEILEKGQYVNVFFSGGVDESYPVQGTAKQINIIVK
jgi:hypothetical protein